MAYNAQALLVEKNATYTFTDGTSSFNMEVTPYSFSATPMRRTKTPVPDHNGGLYAVVDEGLQREPWAASLSGKCIDWAETGATEETLRKILDALADNNATSIDTGTPWVSTNPLTGGGTYMLDFTITVTGVGGSETHTFSFGAVYVDSYSLQSAEGGFEFSVELRGVEQASYATA